MRNVVFLGPPGSGKGTQAARLASELSLTHLSTGDLLRDAVSRKTDLGQKAEQFMAKGELVPDELLIALIKTKLSGGTVGNGVIFDGFPRTIPQAESLDQMLQAQNMPISQAVLLKVPDEEIVKRLSSRWYCPACQKTYSLPNGPQGTTCDGNELKRRPDDEESVVRKRLSVYAQQTAPIVDYYRKQGKLKEIVGNVAPDSVFQSIKAAIS